MPSIRELMPDIEVPHTRAGKMVLGNLAGDPAQDFPAFACHVVQVEHQVSKRINVELVVLLWEFDAPTANGAFELEREVTLVVEVKLEQARVVLAARRGDGFPC